MKNINNLKIGLATGISSVIFYIACFAFMKVAGLESTVKLSNLLFHGMDFSGILRTNIPLSESLLGMGLTFIIWGGFGLLIATIYKRLN